MPGEPLEQFGRLGMYDDQLAVFRLDEVVLDRPIDQRHQRIEESSDVQDAYRLGVDA